MKKLISNNKIDSKSLLLKWVFFGTSRFAVILLEELKRGEIFPSLIVTNPDRPKGRNLVMTASPVKEWGLQENIDLLQPEKLRDPDFIDRLKVQGYDLFIVASYGKIIPKAILDIPRYGSLNIHPSLLPKYRGPSPIQNQILNEEKNIGTTIIKMDEKVDHGPIIAKRDLITDGSSSPLSYSELESKLAIKSAELLSEVLQPWIDNEFQALPQNEKEATFTGILKKQDGLIDLDSDPYQNYLKFLAYEEWPGTSFFIERKGQKIRVNIKDANYKDGKFIIKRVVPAGRPEMDYEGFLNG